MSEVTRVRAAAPSFVRLAPRAAARVRLLCVPYAGAGAGAYRSFPDMLPPWVETWAVRLPARETRLAEEPLTDIRAVVTALVVDRGPR